MAADAPQFFSVEKNLGALRRLLTQLPTGNEQLTTSPPAVTAHLRQVVRTIVDNTAVFDQYCRTNIEWIGPQLIQAAQNFDPDDQSRVDAIADIFTMTYRFLCELEFAIPNDLSMELRATKRFVDDNLGGFAPEIRRQLVFANYVMPAQIARKMLHSPDISAMREFNERSASAAKLKVQWDNELEQKDKDVRVLKDQLAKLETGFNFVGLVDGFRELAKAKQAEKSLAFYSLLLLAGLVVAPVLSEAIFIGLDIEALEKYKQALLFALPPLVALEVLLVYFFRVVLVHFRSIKAQLLQIELRTALCQFIQSYSTYSAAIKKDNPSSLEKFENLIFSGLISSEENLPSTFDGTEQLAKLFKSVKS